MGEQSVTGRLAGRRAVVTGAASGIGYASAALFVAQGAKVIGVDLPGAGLPEAAKAGGFGCLEKSITDEDAPTAIIHTAVRMLEGVDILFNNAGIASSSLAENMPDAEWDRVMNVNIRSVFRLTREAVPHLKQSAAGRIISTSSVMAEGADYGLAPYCASKAGVAGLTRSLALELGKFGITANYLMPGAIRTGMTEPLWRQRPDIADKWGDKAVLRRLGEPQDLANAAVFLASDDAAFITGQGLAVDGGIGLRF